MKTDNQVIAQMARRLRDEQNEQLHIRPWKRHRRFAVPAWLVAIPAAAVAGFFLGIWTNAPTSSDAPQTALADTVYIKVKDVPDTMSTASLPQSSPLLPAASASRPSPAGAHPSSAASSPSSAGAQSFPTTGHSMQADRIRYDLLVRN